MAIFTGTTATSIETISRFGDAQSSKKVGSKKLNSKVDYLTKSLVPL